MPLMETQLYLSFVYKELYINIGIYEYKTRLLIQRKLILFFSSQ